MPSARHSLLKRRSGALKKSMLPARPSLTGAYTTRQLDRIAGYFVLVHAELESYIEERALELVNASYAKWQSDKKLSKTIFGIMAYYEGTRKGPPGSFDAEQFKDRRLETMIGDAVNQHRGRIKSNNGIKEIDVSQMLFPLGFSYADLSTTLLASLNSFGRQRGNFAHQSLTGISGIDPFIEAQTVQNIIQELSIVDAQLSELMRHVS